MATAQEYTSALAQIVALGKAIINQGLALRRALDNQSPPQFEGALAGYVKVNGAFIAFIEGAGGWEGLMTPPAGEFRGDADRYDWVKGRLTVIRELANLDIDTRAWTAAADEIVLRAGGLAKVDLPGSDYHATADEIRKLRAWTIPAGKFAKGYIQPPAAGTFINRIIDAANAAGIDLDGLMKLLAGLKSIAGLALLVLGVYFVWRLAGK